MAMAMAMERIAGLFLPIISTLLNAIWRKACQDPPCYELIPL